MLNPLRTDEQLIEEIARYISSGVQPNPDVVEPFSGETIKEEMADVYFMDSLVEELLDEYGMTKKNLSDFIFVNGWGIASSVNLCDPKCKICFFIPFATSPYFIYYFKEDDANVCD